MAGTININQLLTEDILLSDFLVKADSNGLATKATVQGLANKITTTGDVAFKGKVASTDATVTNDGWYFAEDSGTYTNNGGLVIDISNNLAIIIVSNTQTTFSKVDIPLNITFDAVPTDGSTNAPESGGVFDELALKQNSPQFPFNSRSQIDSPFMLEVSNAIKEVYIVDFDDDFDYLLYVFRYKQDLSGTVTTDIRLGKATKGTNSVISFYKFNLTGANATNYNEGDGLQVIELSGNADVNLKAYLLINWNELTEENGYGSPNVKYLLSDLINSQTYNRVLHTYTKDEVIANFYNKSETDTKFIEDDFFPFASEGLVNTDLLLKTSKAVKEIYIPDYTNTADYLLSSFRYNQLASGLYRLDIRVAQVETGTTTLIKYYAFTIADANPLNYDIGDGLQIIELTNGGYMLVDWNELTEGEGYGALSRNYLLSNKIGNASYNQSLALEYEKDNRYSYSKLESDTKYTEKVNTYTKSETFTQAESNTNYASKSTTETQLSNHEGRITQNETDNISIDADNQLIKGKLDQLIASPPDAGALTGNNTFTGANTFAQPVVGVAPSADTHFIRQLEYKNTLNRVEDAADYGFLPTATASDNVTALNAALLGGNKTIYVTKPGIYEINGTSYIDDYTHIHFCKGVELKRVTSNYSFVLINRGALTHSYNKNISVTGLVINANQKDLVPPVESPLYGLRGHLSFLCINNLYVEDFKCYNYNTPQWALHVCSFNNFILDRFECRGNKDGVHLGRGDGAIIQNGVCETYDDAIALNGHDYTSCNPEVGDIKNVLIKNVTDLNQENITGYFSRLLIGAWVDWYDGILIQNGDTVVNNGKTYRAISNVNETTNYTSQTEPTLTTFDATQADASGGFVWKLFQNDAVYSANMYNIVFRDITCLKPRIFANIELDFGNTFYNRSIHPDVPVSDYPYTNQIRLVNCDLEKSAQVINTKSNFDIILDNVHNHNARINLTTLGDKISKATIKNCDFTKVTGDAISQGVNTYVKIRDCSHNGTIAMSSSGRLESNENIEGFLNITPVLGDNVKVGNIPYLWNGSAWISQI
jgi:hypothetical protein